jgi:hypothetical protein
VKAERLNVRADGLEDPQPVKDQQGDQGMLGWAA